MTSNHICQFRITLKEISPPIWRRILVPEDYSFWDLHVAIQDAMGWLDCHLHVFRMKRRQGHKVMEIGIPDEDLCEGDPEIMPGWKIPIAKYFATLGMTAEYVYDFGDNWIHEVLLEGYLLKEKGVKYPRCIEGARACPPEDCGSGRGYYEILEILSDPTHDEYEQTLTWLGGGYDPDRFDPAAVKFDNPKKRWQIAFLEP